MYSVQQDICSIVALYIAHHLRLTLVSWRFKFFTATDDLQQQHPRFLNVTIWVTYVTSLVSGRVAVRLAPFCFTAAAFFACRLYVRENVCWMFQTISREHCK